MSHQVKEDTPDVLPDGSRLYCLPSVSHNQHRFTFFIMVQDDWIKYIVNIKHLVESRITSEPSTLRAITADTMADVLEGRYNHKLRNVRIIDCRLEQLHFLLGPGPIIVTEENVIPCPLIDRSKYWVLFCRLDLRQGHY